MKKIYVFAGLVCLIGIVSWQIGFSHDNGAPFANTGAPGEESCNAAGCHTSFAVNSGTGIITIKLLDGTTEVTKYQPGKVYSVTIELSDPNSFASGFESTIKKQGSSLFAGTFSLGGSFDIKFSDNQHHYPTHVNPFQAVQGHDSWTYKWTAPVSGTGNVVIYAAANGANNNGQSTGDHIYTTSKLIGEVPAGIETGMPAVTNVSIFPNPCIDGRVSLKIDAATFASETIAVYSLEGKCMLSKITPLHSGENSVTMDIQSLDPGVYLVKLTDGKNEITKKIIKS